MLDTTFSRKLDSTGRIMVPIRLREQMGMQVGQIYSFSTLEMNGRKYICIDCGAAVSDEELNRALQLVQSQGMKVIQNEK